MTVSKQNSESYLSPPHNDDAWQFPFPPYDIQLHFMQELYIVAEHRKVGVFESPTGTGKSLSITCGALKWLDDNYHRADLSSWENRTDNDGRDNEPAWLKAFDQKAQLSPKEKLLNHYRLVWADRIETARKNQVKKSIKQNKRFSAVKYRKVAVNGAKSDPEDDEEFLVDPYESDGEGRSTTKVDHHSNLTAGVKDLLAQFEAEDEVKRVQSAYLVEKQEEEEEPDEIKVFYASRTHSQLSQFIREVRKTEWGRSLRTVSLGSRKNLCIHEDVQKLGNVTAMNEKCLDMQQSKTAKAKCQYLHSGTSVRDIEDIADLGRDLEICPYYGSRRAIKAAQLVTLPYNMLLSASSRRSLGISLRDNVVIIDEAHNLMDTISSIHSAIVNERCVLQAKSQLEQYLKRYYSRLKGENVSYIKKLIVILKGLKRIVDITKDESGRAQERMMSVSDLLHRAGIDHLNMFKVAHYLQKSKIARKLNGFSFHVQQANDRDNETDVASHKTQSAMSAFSQIESFLLALTHADNDGCIITGVSSQDHESAMDDNYHHHQVFIKYLLLNPGTAFTDIIEEARSIILAGGTMEPVSAFRSELLGTLPDSRLSHLSCGHIIPKENLMALCLSQGPSKQLMEFSYEKRSQKDLVQDLGQTIVNLCNVIPHGVVCFFASYNYMYEVFQAWKSSGITARIARRKKVYLEPKNASEVEGTLRDFALHIDTKPDETKGAILMCVVGGKMSEGINFSDQLGRGVIMVGLPFANLQSAELSARMRYVGSHANITQTLSTAPLDTKASQEYYENLCMRAVNQSIGRAIRHRGDYATIILLDHRFTQARIKQKLPAWIRQEVTDCASFGQALAGVSRFFRGKQVS